MSPNARPEIKIAINSPYFTIRSIKIFLITSSSTIGARIPTVRTRKKKLEFVIISASELTFAASAPVKRTITRLITNHTNLQKKCQYCGKPAEVKNNKQDPYKIQFICKSCRAEKNLNTKENRYIMCDDIPLIDVRDYLTSDRIKSKIIKLTPELIEKLKYILTSNLTKNQVLKYLNLSQTRFNDVVNLYTETIDKDYKEKLAKIFYKNSNFLLCNKFLL